MNALWLSMLNKLWLLPMVSIIFSANSLQMLIVMYFLAWRLLMTPTRSTPYMRDLLLVVINLLIRAFTNSWLVLLLGILKEVNTSAASKGYNLSIVSLTLSILSSTKGRRLWFSRTTLRVCDEKLLIRGLKVLSNRYWRRASFKKLSLILAVYIFWAVSPSARFNLSPWDTISLTNYLFLLSLSIFPRRCPNKFL